MLNIYKKGSIAIAIMMAFTYFMPTYASAYYAKTTEDRINMILDDIFEERSKGNEADTQIKELEKVISSIEISDNIISSSKSRAFNKWIDLGKGWKYQVHRPHGSTATQYHVHVKGKVGKNSVEAKEALNGDSTHGKNNTMNDKKVPKDIQKKIKNDKNYKDAKKEESKAKSAKAQMNAKKLNLRNVSDLIIGIGIFISVVGIALFAVNLYSAWMPVLLAL